MKPLKIILFIVIVALSACKLDPPYVTFTNVAVNIDEKTIPINGIVNQPLLISAHCYAPDGCWNGLHFTFTKREDFQYELSALGNYESYGSCTDVLVTNDTIISFTPTVAGDYVITTWVTPYTFERDTIDVTEPGR